MLPLATYGLVIVALAIKGSFTDFKQCHIDIRIWDQVLIKYLMASFDVITAAITFVCLYRKGRGEPISSWLNDILRQDQVGVFDISNRVSLCH